MRLGVHVNNDFERRGLRMGLILTLFVALVILLVATVIWGGR